jgi:hypothetical protein
MITAGIIDEVLDGARDRIAEALNTAYQSLLDPLFGWMSNPLIPWGFKGAAVVAVCFVIGWFFPFKWVRAALGFVVLLVAAFFAGLYQMHKEMAAKAAKKIKRK